MRVCYSQALKAPQKWTWFIPRTSHSIITNDSAFHISIHFFCSLSISYPISIAISLSSIICISQTNDAIVWSVELQISSGWKKIYTVIPIECSLLFAFLVLFHTFAVFVVFFRQSTHIHFARFNISHLIFFSSIGNHYNFWCFRDMTKGTRALAHTHRCTMCLQQCFRMRIIMRWLQLD